jgi:hypothetical protein
MTPGEWIAAHRRPPVVRMCMVNAIERERRGFYTQRPPAEII